MSIGLYTLNAQGEPIPEPDIDKWAGWITDAREQRRVGREAVGDSIINTTFLGVDHAWIPGPPVLWETMVFGGPSDHESTRCGGSREQAEAMHARMVERVKAAIHVQG